VRAIVILATAALLAGCTTRFDVGGGEWTKPFPDTIVGGLADIVAAKIQDVKMSRDFGRCMSAKGYQPARG